MKTLVIIPAFNEELSIEGVIDDVREHLPAADIIVIDDGSGDSTAALARGKGAPVISLSYNLGIGAAMQTGYKYANARGYDIAFQFDADGQHRGDQFSALLGPLLSGEADICLGSRFREKGMYEAEFARFIGIRILSGTISLLMGQKVTDPTSGFRGANRRVIEFYCSSYPDDYPEPEALILLHRAGFRLVEVPVLMRKRLLGTSSITFIRAFYYMIKVILAIMIDLLKKVPGR
ncbi:MAG: glycosyltransferase family 2 protein [Nitrospirae bacterium]|nr:glycosyltransferase family 2 protein [Nitrospirota bacterium]